MRIKAAQHIHIERLARQSKIGLFSGLSFMPIKFSYKNPCWNGLSLIFATLKCRSGALCFLTKPYTRPDMNIFFDFGRFDRRLPKVNMVFLALAMAMVSGCGKSESTPPTASAPPPSPPSTPPPAATPAAPTSADSQPAAQLDADNTKKQLQMLNRAMMGWMMQNHRRPQNFEDFASSANMQIPNPPAGKKYAFDSRGFIVLVNSTQ